MTLRDDIISAIGSNTIVDTDPEVDEATKLLYHLHSAGKADDQAVESVLGSLSPKGRATFESKFMKPQKQQFMGGTVDPYQHGAAPFVDPYTGRPLK